MHPLFKKRLKQRKKESYLVMNICGFLMGNVWAYLVYSVLKESPGGAANFHWWYYFLSLGLGLIVAHAIELTVLATSNVTRYDEKIEKEEEPLRIKSEQIEGSFLTSIVKEASELEIKLEKEMARALKEILVCINILKEECNLSSEEKHYILYTLPKDIMETIELYKKLGTQKREQKKNVILFLNGRLKKLEERIQSYRMGTEKDLMTKLAVAENREF